MLDYCHEKGYEVSHRFSEACSGLTLDRPKLRELQGLIRTGNIDVIVIYCLDRISRDPTHGVILTQEFEKLGIALESVTEDISNSELGKLISYIRGFASKLEAEKIRERTMRGKMAYLKEGRLPQGTGIGIYGYNWDKTTGRRQIIDHEAETVRKVFNMAISGMSLNRMAMTLNESDSKTKSGSLWHCQTVKRLLNNLNYTGKTYFGQTKRISKTKVEAQPEESWILLPDITPPIMDIAHSLLNKDKWKHLTWSELVFETLCHYRLLSDRITTLAVPHMLRFAQGSRWYRSWNPSLSFSEDEHGDPSTSNELSNELKGAVWDYRYHQVQNGIRNQDWMVLSMSVGN
ncbi:recombinase family protein [Chloroflexota bacterium]